MRRASALLLAAAAAAVLAPHTKAQNQDPPAGQSYDFQSIKGTGLQTGDYYEQRKFGGFVFTVPGLGIEIRGLNGVILSDIDARTMLADRSSSGLPRRGVELPGSRRRMSPEQMRQRIVKTMRTFGQEGTVAQSPQSAKALDLVRFLYFEGGVVVLRDGVELMRCERLWIAPLEDRVVAEEVELRYGAGSAGGTTIVIRGPKLTKSGTRWTGRDLTITSCTAAEPHVALAVGEAEIIERENELEIITRGQSIQIGGTNVLPLPDAHFFSGSQSQFPIKRASASYSDKEGFETEVVLSLPWNVTGGRLHNLITGRPAGEFRGEWELGIGYLETRGVPIAPALEYSAPGLYTGRTEAFWLDDRGVDLRELKFKTDGSTTESRGLIRTENRVFLGDNTHFDVQAFSATDGAVLSEFFPAQYRGRETPETSGYLHHSTSNHLITFGTRSNLNSFSYRDNRSLAPRFIEELPVMTWNWLAQPIAETWWETPVVLDMSTDLGQRRSDYDERVPGAVRQADRTFRADQNIEVSTPFALGPINLRPFISGRGTFYDNTRAGGSEGRIAFEGGVQLGTRLSRVFSWANSDGVQSVRHVIAPRITFTNRFHVDDRPIEFYQFDSTDALTERNLVRLELRNLLQRNEDIGDSKGPSDFLMVDLAQDIWPDASRDNAGEELGLFYYDVLVRPRARWVPFDTFTYAIYGDHDWKTGLRTLDTELRFGPLANVTWTLEYRTDSVFDGAVGISAHTNVFDRWNLFASSLYDLESKDWLTYGFGLQRVDHDWTIALSAGYDPFTDDTSLRIEFMPTIPGLTRTRTRRFGGTPLHDAGFATQY